MNYMTSPENLSGVPRDKAAHIIKTKCFTDDDSITVSMIEEDLGYYAWPQAFGSTCGPFPGIGGSAISTFTIEAWEFNGKALYFCQGKPLSCIDFVPLRYK